MYLDDKGMKCACVYQLFGSISFYYSSQATFKLEQTQAISKQSIHVISVSLQRSIFDYSQSSKTSFLTTLAFVNSLIQTTIVLISNSEIVSGSFRKFGGSTKFGFTSFGA